MPWYFLLSLLVGCSGYRFTQQDNPLSQYGIRSLSIPMFYNYSNLPEPSPDFTRETYKILNGFPGLKIVSGYSKKTDAVLIGVIRSPEQMIETHIPSNIRSAKTRASTSIGSERQNFYVPGTNSINLGVQLIVIKRPTEAELELLRSPMGAQVPKSSKVIFNEFIAASSSHTIEILDRAGTQVNATQTAGVRRKTIKSMAESAAMQIRDMIFYAF
jgi:hypothetical protein